MKTKTNYFTRYAEHHEEKRELCRKIAHVYNGFYKDTLELGERVVEKIGGDCEYDYNHYRKLESSVRLHFIKKSWLERTLRNLEE